jgi:hypothetical protein
MGVGGREVVLILESLEHESMRWWEGHVMRKYHADCRPFALRGSFCTNLWCSGLWSGSHSHGDDRSQREWGDGCRD